jgi:acylphosphatase
MRARRHLRIDGRVQGVGFRASATHHMLELGLHGYARNTAAGEVEVVVEGEPEALDAFAAWCRIGPRLAHVTRVSVREEEPEGLSGVEVR